MDPRKAFIISRPNTYSVIAQNNEMQQNKKNVKKIIVTALGLRVTFHKLFQVSQGC